MIGVYTGKTMSLIIPIFLDMIILINEADEVAGRYRNDLGYH